MTLLQDYFAEIRRTIRGFTGIHVERYQEQLLTPTRANLRVKLRLPDKSFLEISEALAAEETTITWLSYLYHWQDPTGHLVLRYDNAPHHPEIETFPHHKHVAETAEASQRPSLPDLLNDIRRLITKR